MNRKKPVNNTSFKEAALAVVRAIPKGQTMSYKEVAIAAKSPLAARAVARLMSANYDETVPCHRVIKSNGQLGGYNRGGEAVKRGILESESKK